MCIQELSTCKQYGLNVKILCLNNQALGMVKQWQDMNYEGRHSSSYVDSLPDFAIDGSLWSRRYSNQSCR